MRRPDFHDDREESGRDSMQTILGANGVIARELSRQLSLYTYRIRQVSRSPRPLMRRVVVRSA